MWKYQIVKNEIGIYSVREVVKIKGKKAVTEDEIAPWGESRDEMRASITQYLNDIMNSKILVIDEDGIIGDEAPLTKLSPDELK